MKITDQDWMRRAAELARRGKFSTSPNPMVGVCVVKSGRLVGEGCHKQFGGPHAEVFALKAAGRRAKSAALYVTLEPCASWGKTPPCAGAIQQTGIKKVIIGSLDPNPRNRGRGAAFLKKVGIKIVTGVLKNETDELIAPFRKWVTTRMPFVTLKMAQTLDGKIASVTGRSRWITSPAARNYVHELRAENDAVLVGKNTLIRDNPLLSPRQFLKRCQPGKPWRIILDGSGKNSKRLRAFRGEQLTFAVVPDHKIQNASPAVLLPVKFQKGRVDFKDLLKKLGALGVSKLLVEGGGETAWSLLHEGLVDRLLWIVAPKILGGREAKTSVEGEGFSSPTQSLPLCVTHVKNLGEDWIFEAIPKPMTRNLFQY